MIVLPLGPVIGGIGTTPQFMSCTTEVPWHVTETPFGPLQPEFARGSPTRQPVSAFLLADSS